MKKHNGFAIIPVLLIVLVINIIFTKWANNGTNRNTADELFYLFFVTGMPIIAGGLVYHYVNKEIGLSMVIFVVSLFAIVLGFNKIIRDAFGAINVFGFDHLAEGVYRTMYHAIQISLVPIVINVVKDKAKKN